MAGRVVLGRSQLQGTPVGAGITGFTVVWRGWDGSVWDLSSGANGVALQPGFRGFILDDVQNYDREGPATPGATWNGFRVNSREVFLPLLIFHGNASSEWADLHTAFFRTLRPGREGRIEVTHPNGSVRYLTVRFQSTNNQAYDLDPGISGWAIYGITLKAHDPFWHSDPIVKAFGGVAPEDYFNRPAGQVAFLSSSTNFTTAKISNPGDHEAYIVWTINGAFETVKVGVAGKNISLPFPLDGNDRVTIDTDPRDMRVMKNGTNVTNQLTTVPKYAPAPPEENIPLTISYTGLDSGLVEARIIPRYYGAW